MLPRVFKVGGWLCSLLSLLLFSIAPLLAQSTPIPTATAGSTSIADRIATMGVEAKVLRSTAAAFASARAGLPEEIASLEAEIAAPAIDVSQEFAKLETTEKLREVIQAAEEALNAAQNTYGQAAIAAERDVARNSLLLAEQGELAAKIEKQKDLQAGTVMGVSGGAEFDAAVADLADARLLAIGAELELIAARRAVLPLRLVAARRRVFQIEERIGAAREQLRRVQESDFANQTSKLLVLRQESGALSHEVAQDIYALRALKGRGGDELSDKVKQAQLRRDEAKRLQIGLARDLSDLWGRYRLVDGSSGIGPLLASFSGKLLNESVLRARGLALRNELQAAQLLLFSLEEQRSLIGAPPDEIKRLIDRATVEGKRISWKERHAAAELVGQRDQLLNELLAEGQSYVMTLTENVTFETQLEKLTEEARQFLAPRLVWIRSLNRESVPSVRDVAGVVNNIFGAERLRELVRGVAGKSFEELLSPLFFLLFFVGLFALRPRIVAHERVLCAQVSQLTQDKFSLTLVALMLISIESLLIPGAVYFVGAFLRSVDSSLGQSLGTALVALGFVLYVPLWWFNLLRTDGVAVRHFRWDEKVCKDVRKLIGRYLPLLAATLFILEVFRLEHDMRGLFFIRRVLFFTFLAIYAAFVARLVAPKGPLAPLWSVSPFASERFGGSRNFLIRSHWLWWKVVVALPILCGLFGFLGYENLSYGFVAAYRHTTILIGAFVIVHALFLRALLITQRRRLLALRPAPTNMPAVEPASSNNSEGSGGITLNAFPMEADSTALMAKSEGWRLLFRSNLLILFLLGVFSIWSHVLPLLPMLGRVHVYPELRVASLAEEAQPFSSFATSASVNAGASAQSKSGTPPDGDVVGKLMSVAGGEPADSKQVTTQPITLHGILVVGLLCYVVAVSTRTLPAVLDLVLLKRLNLSAGGNYAASTLLRYVVILVGIFAASSLLGISWSNVHWLVAALTFGLGFGLQEVFANFVSGIIVLFEQPVRVGDIVTIGNVSGVVSKIRIRATTITDWDRKELIIPNKNLVTGDIVNWTLSHRLLRVRIPVGVSYDSDPDKVIRILKEIAARDERLTVDPPTSVWFTSFGPSSLDFELVVYVRDVNDNIDVQRDLRVAITREFRAQGVEIAFPQQDIHIRTAPAGVIREVGKEAG